MNETMTSRERVIAALRGEKTDRPPVLSVCQHATFEQMESLRVAWPAAQRDGSAMAALSAGGYSLLGLDAVRVPYCQTFEAEALGAVLKKGDTNNLPSVNEHPFKLDDEPVLPPDFLERGSIPQLLEAIRQLKQSVGDKVIVMGGIVGPFSIATSLLGVTDLLKTAFKKPEKVEPFISLGEQAGTKLALALVEAGADVIVVEDMMASLDMVSPKIYRTLVAPNEQKQFAAITVPTILHICGKLDAVMVDIAATGATAISVEPAVDIPLALKNLEEAGYKVPLVGAVDPINALFNGTPKEVEAEVHKCLSQGISIISPGCAVPPAAPMANLLAMVNAVKSTSKGGEANE